MVRLINLDDRFDGHNTSQIVDLNAYAKEMYMEANSHLLKNLTSKAQKQLMGGVKLNITEMNLAGSISLAQMNQTNLTHWRTDDSADPKADVIQPPKDLVKTIKETEVWNVALEPQRIRVFKILYQVSKASEVAEVKEPVEKSEDEKTMEKVEKKSAREMKSD